MSEEAREPAEAEAEDLRTPPEPESPAPRPARAPSTADLVVAGQKILGPALKAAEEDTEVRDALRTFSLWMTAQVVALDGGEHAPAAKAGPPRTVRKSVPRPRAEGDGEGEDGEDRSRWRRADPEVQLEVVEARSQLKADACRWVGERRRALEEGRVQGLARQDAEFFERAREMPESFLWCMHSSAVLPDDEGLERLALCYENVSLCAKVGQHYEKLGAIPEELLKLFAEIQSALRRALNEANVEYDADQLQLFRYTRDHAYANRTFIERHMRRGDEADPDEAMDQRTRLLAFVQEAQKDEGDEKERKRLLSKLRYSLKKADEADGESEVRYWNTIFETLDLWVEQGRPVDDKTVLRMLSARIDEIPEDCEIGQGAEKVLDAVELLVEQIEAEA